jgi:hypothetical protein
LYATVRRYEGVTDPSEAGQRVNEGFVPLISKVPGFVAYYWVDAGGGVMISTSVFQDQFGAEESNKEGCGFCARESGLVASNEAPDHGWRSCRLQRKIINQALILLSS